MSRSLRSLAAVLAATTIVAGGCASGSRAPETTAAPATTVATETVATEPTTTEAAPEPINEAETRWRAKVETYSERLEAHFGRSGAVTHATMRRSAKLYAACTPMLHRAGEPGRFEPVLPQVERACNRLEKAARLLGLAIAASGPGGTVVAGTPEQRQFDRGFSGAIEAAGNAQFDVQRALEKAAAIEAELQA